MQIICDRRVGDFSDEAHLLADAAALAPVAQIVVLHALSYNDEPQVLHGCLRPGEGAQQQGQVLLRAQTPHVNQHAVVGVEIQSRALKFSPGIAEPTQIHSVGHDFDGRIHSISAQQFRQAGGGRYHQIALAAEAGQEGVQKGLWNGLRQVRQVCLCVQIVTGVVGENDGYLAALAIAQCQPSAGKRVVHVRHIHFGELVLRAAVVAEGKIVSGVRQRHCRRADHIQFLVHIILAAEGEYEHLMALGIQRVFSERDMMCHPTDVRFVRISQHADQHGMSA